MHQAKAKCSSSDAEKALGLSDEGQWPSLEPLPLGREILSLTCGSGLFLGLWGVRCPVQDNGVTLPGGARRQWGAMAMTTMCLLLGLAGRDISHSQGDKDLGSFRDIQPCQCPWPSPPQSILHCPRPVAVSPQAADTPCASPPCSHPSVSPPVLLSLHPHQLFLETQSHG